MTPQTPPPEMPAEHAILGLLMLDDGVGHGYDLARHFSEGQPLAMVIRLESGMLYHHLKKLARVNWVTSTVEPQGSRPPRQMYRITAAGRAEVNRWLSEPVSKTREIRLEFLVKLYFAWHLVPNLVPRLVAEQRDILRGLMQSLQEQLTQLAVSEESMMKQDSIFLEHVLRLRYSQTEAAIAWLEHLDDMGTGQPIP